MKRYNKQSHRSRRFSHPIEPEFEMNRTSELLGMAILERSFVSGAIGALGPNAGLVGVGIPAVIEDDGPSIAIPIEEDGPSTIITPEDGNEEPQEDPSDPIIHVVAPSGPCCSSKEFRNQVHPGGPMRKASPVPTRNSNTAANLRRGSVIRDEHLKVLTKAGLCSDDEGDGPVGQGETAPGPRRTGTKNQRNQRNHNPKPPPRVVISDENGMAAEDQEQEQEKKSWVQRNLLICATIGKLIAMIATASLAGVSSFQYYAYNDPVQIWLLPENEPSTTSQLLLAQTAVAAFLVPVAFFAFFDVRLASKRCIPLITIMFGLSSVFHVAVFLAAVATRRQLTSTGVESSFIALLDSQTSLSCNRKVTDIQHSYDCCIILSQSMAADYFCLLRITERSCQERMRSFQAVANVPAWKSYHYNAKDNLNVDCYNATYFDACFSSKFSKDCTVIINGKIQTATVLLGVFTLICVLSQSLICYLYGLAYCTIDSRTMQRDTSTSMRVPDLFSPEFPGWFLQNSSSRRSSCSSCQAAAKSSHS